MKWAFWFAETTQDSLNQSSNWQGFRYSIYMAKISKRADAPEGDIRVSVANDSFKVSDDSPYETDNQALIDFAEASDLLDVEIPDDEDAKEAAKEEARLLKELQKEQEKAEKQRATKDPQEPAAEKPTSVADLKETKADEAKGGKK